MVTDKTKVKEGEEIEIKWRDGVKKSKILEKMSAKKITYKDAIEELEDIVHGIENEDIDVDDLAKKVERAKLLKEGSDK